MVATDTSSIIALFRNDPGADVALLVVSLSSGQVFLPPVVLAELLSEQSLDAEDIAAFNALPLLDITDGYWARAGAMRRKILGKGLRARLPDTLIAQSCIDHDVALITRDGDFRHFAKYCGLKLA